MLLKRNDIDLGLSTLLNTGTVILFRHKSAPTLTNVSDEKYIWMHCIIMFTKQVVFCLCVCEHDDSESIVSVSSGHF